MPRIRRSCIRKQDRQVNESFFKFPSTPHLATLSGVEIRDDKVLTAKERSAFLTRELTVEEKVDGANLGISFDSGGNVRAQNRGGYLEFPRSGQWRPLQDWLTRRAEALFDTLIDQYILFGEWCYARHSVCYSRLPDWFLGFDIYDRQSARFLSVPRRNALCNKIGVAQVPIVARGRFAFEELVKLLTKSALADQPAEGIYLRSDSGKWLAQRVKVVCPEFLGSLGAHWSRSAIEPNRLLADHVPHLGPNSRRQP